MDAISNRAIPTDLGSLGSTGTAENAINAVNSDCFEKIEPLTPPQSALPPFPLEALPSPIDEYVQAVAKNTQTAPEMGGIIALGVLATCLQDKYFVRVSGNYTEPLNLFVVIIAPPGERKSAVMHLITGVLAKFEREFAEAQKPIIQQNHQERESLERKIACYKRKLEQEPNKMLELELRNTEECLAALPEIAPKRYIADDCTSEALIHLLATNDGVISVISEEGGIFGTMSGRYNNGQANFDVWLKGHCGDPIHVDRIGRAAEIIVRPTLTAILAIQPSVLQQIMQNSAMAGKGLLARFLYVFPTSQIGHRAFLGADIPAQTTSNYFGLINRLMSLPTSEDRQEFTICSEALNILSEHFESHEKYLAGTGQAISDWAAKYIGAVIRISGLLHGAIMVTHDDRCISADTMQSAIKIGQYLLAQAEFAYSRMCEDQTIQKARFVWAKLREKGVSEIKRSDLFQACRGKFFHKTVELIPILDLMEEHGYIRQVTPTYHGTGRPPDVQIMVNPAARDMEI